MSSPNSDDFRRAVAAMPPNEQQNVLKGLQVLQQLAQARGMVPPIGDGIAGPGGGGNGGTNFAVGNPLPHREPRQIRNLVMPHSQGIYEQSVEWEWKFEHPGCSVTRVVGVLNKETKEYEVIIFANSDEMHLSSEPLEAFEDILYTALQWKTRWREFVGDFIVGEK